MGLPIPEWFDPTQTRDGDGSYLMISGPVGGVRRIAWILLNKLLLLLVARSVGHTALAVGERGDDTASAACTSILYRVC